MNFKVLHLISSAGLYGAEQVILNLSQEMKNTDFKPVIGLIISSKYENQEIEIEAKNLGIDTITLLLKNNFHPLNIKIITNTLKDNMINLVHSHGYKATIFSYVPSLIVGVPLTVTCHLWTKETWKLKLYSIIESVAMRYLPAVVGVSEDICNEIIHRGVPKEKVHLIHNGINLKNYSSFSPKSIVNLKQSLNIQKNDFVIGTIGRLTKQKSQHDLLKAVRALKDKGIRVKCLIIGDGYLRNDLETYKAALGLNSNVFFLGFRKDALQLLTLMDLFIMTSNKEGLPIALLEAMFYKKPIISTPVGDINKLITHGETGFLYQVSDINSLVDHIITLKNNSTYRLGLSNAAYEKVLKEFTSESMTKKYLSIYSNLLANSH